MEVLLLNSIPQRTYWPTTEWQTCEPQAVGLQHGPLMQMQDYIDEHLSGLHSLLIVHQGYLTFERYYHGFHQHSLYSISSATKSVISALVGVAIDTCCCQEEIPVPPPPYEGTLH